MPKKELERKLSLENSLPEVKVSASADSEKLLLSLVKGEELKDDPVVGNISRVDGVVSEESSKKLAFYYLKEEEKLDLSKLKSVVRGLLGRFSKHELQLDVTSFKSTNLTEEEAFKAVAEVVLLTKYKVFSLRGEKKEKKEEVVTLVSKLENAESLLSEVKEVVSRINLVKDLQVLPPNIANSEFLADVYKTSLLSHPKIKTTVLTKKDIEEKGMGLLLAVNRGSEHEARLVVAEFNNNPDSEEKVALVGKGITFDSGGYNLKPSMHMSEMKFDMSGSAIVAGVMSLVAALDLKVNVVGLMPLTDNKIGKRAGTPDSVWRSYSGKSVEINNTDAEGRLVLADAMSYAIKDCGASEIITVATLTGAMIYALGHTFTGYWSTKCDRASRFESAAKESDELIWRMPFHEDFLVSFKDTPVADITNVNNKSKAGSSNAAMFLKEFSEDKVFSHFDIAGTAWQNGVPKAPLVKTLTTYLKGKTSCPKEGSCKA